jgi:hypothetical protein
VTSAFQNGKGSGRGFRLLGRARLFQLLLSLEVFVGLILCKAGVGQSEEFLVDLVLLVEEADGEVVLLAKLTDSKLDLLGEAHKDHHCGCFP